MKGKKTLALILALILAVSVMTVAALAADEEVRDIDEVTAQLQARGADEIRAQGQYMAENGYFTGVRTTEGLGDSTYLYYIAEGAYTNEFLTVVAAPNGVRAVDEMIAFVEDEGWIEQMDKYGECLLVIPAPEDGWGTEHDVAHIIAGLPTFGSPRAMGVFSGNCADYIVAYGEACAAMQAYAAATPHKVSSQVYIDASEDVSGALAEAGEGVINPWSNWDGEYAPVTKNTLAVPTLYFGEYSEANLAYWNAAKAADALTTSYFEVDVTVGVSGDEATAANIIDFLNNYVRNDNTTPYGNNLKERKVFLENDNIHVYDFDWTDPASGYVWNRQYLVYVPDSAAELYPEGAPTVYAIHGATQSGTVFFNETSWPEIADELGYIVVFPSGTVSANNPSRCGWSTIAEAAETSTRIPDGDTPSDIDFIKEVIARVDAEYNTCGSERRYIHGNSAGSMNSNLMAQTITEYFTALGTTSGPIMGDNATVTGDYGPYIWDGVEGSNASVMAGPTDEAFPAYLVFGSYDHWPASVGYIDQEAVVGSITDGKFVGLFPGAKYGRSYNTDNPSVEIDWPFRTQLYWALRNGAIDLPAGIDYADVASAITGKTFTYDYYTEYIEEAFYENMEVTNEKYFGEAGENGKYDAAVVVGQAGYNSKENIEAALAAEDNIDRYTTYTWYNEDDIPVFMWSESYGRSHEMTPDDLWLIATTWFEHWTMDENGVRYYDGVALANPEAEADPVVSVSSQTVTVDGEEASVEAYNVDGYNFLKLRDVAALLTGTASQFGVGYDEVTRTVTAEPGESYTPTAGDLVIGEDMSATLIGSTQKLVVDSLTLDIEVYNIGGYNYFKLRDLGLALGFDVVYEQDSNTAVITTAEAESIVFRLEDAIELGAYEWELSEDGTCATLRDVHYCTDPVDVYYDDEGHLYQSMIIIVPAEYLTGGEVNGYTAETAPIILKNNCQGWNSSIPRVENDDSVITYAEQVKAGFIYVGCGARSRNLAEGNAPAPIVDLKAGIRFLKLNDDVIPGDSGRIVSMGGSGAGEMTSVIGATGNMDEYFPYLYEIGAAGVDYVDGEYVSTIGDDVFGNMAFYPIADIENADIAYAWLRCDSGELGVTRRGTFTAFTPFQLALQEDLAIAFCEYVNELGLTDAEGSPLSFDVDENGDIISPRQGSYYDAVLDELSKALALFLAEQEDPDAFIMDNYGVDGALPAWLAEEGGAYKVTDMSGFLNGTGLNRNKQIPGFDTLDLSAENNAFGTEEETAVHYSASVAAVLAANYEEYAALDGFNAEQVDLYIEQADREDIVYQTYLMNATHIMFDVADGTQEADIAPNWRIRVGTADQHTSFTVGYNMALAAIEAGIDADYSLVWNMVHGSEKEGTSAGTFIDWVDSICK